MKRQISIYLLKSVAVSFLIAAVLSLAVFAVYQSQQVTHYENGMPRMNCLPGFGVAIFVGFSLFMAILSLGSLFNLKERFRKNGVLRFLSFYLLPVAFALYATFFEKMNIETRLTFAMPLVLYLLPWTFFYWKFGKKFV